MVMAHHSPECAAMLMAATEPAKKWADTDRAELRKYKGGGDIVPMWMIMAGALVILVLVYSML